MDRTERFYKIQRLLNQRKVVPRDAFISELEVSRATFKRDLEYLRDRMQMPIVWDREQGGYRIDTAAATAHLFQLPGLWFSSEEIYALLTMEHMLERLQPGLLGPQLRPLRELIRRALESGDDLLTPRVYRPASDPIILNPVLREQSIDDMDPDLYQRSAGTFTFRPAPVTRFYFNAIGGGVVGLHQPNLSQHLRTEDLL